MQQPADVGRRLIEKYFEGNPLHITQHHIESYNAFVERGIPAAVASIPIVVVRNDESGQKRHRIVITLKDVTVAKPVYCEPDGRVKPLYPNDARVKNLSYTADVFANVNVEYVDERKKTSKTVAFPEVRIGAIPVMLGSRVCVLEGMPAAVRREMGESSFDQGGFFISNGKEKVIISQEQIAGNRPFITQDDGGKDGEAGSNHHFSWKAIIRSQAPNDTFPKTNQFNVYNSSLYEGRRKNCIVLRLKDIGTEIPIFWAFRALGVESDHRILQLIVGDVSAPANAPLLSFLYPSVVDGHSEGLFTRQAVEEHLKAYVRYKNVQHVRGIFSDDFLRNARGSTRAKAMLLGMIINKIVRTAMGLLPVKSRDSFVHKRVYPSGLLLSNLFRDLYNQFRRHVRGDVEGMYLKGGWGARDDLTGLIRANELDRIFDASIIQGGFDASMRGRWGAGASVLDNDGIVQDLNRVSFAAYISSMRRLNTPMDRSIKLVEPRRVQGSQWGVVCPAQSPDGKSIGLDKHLSALAIITPPVDVRPLLQCLVDLGCRPIADIGVEEMHGVEVTRVYLNNDLFGIHADPTTLVRTVRLYRRNGLVCAYMSVYNDSVSREVWISCEQGRVCRPLLIVEGGRLLLPRDLDKVSWADLLSPGRALDDSSYVPPREGLDLVAGQAAMELVDVEESNNIMCTMWPSEIAERASISFTHCEVHPSSVLSLYTNSIPFAHHNFSPRNVFSGQQGKQALGVYATNFASRMDALAYVLHAPQRPLVTTMYNRLMKGDDMPNGENLLIAVMCNSGYNQEDAVIVNRASVERGMFNLTYYHSSLEREDVQRMGSSKVVFANPHALQRAGISIKPNAESDSTIDERGMPRMNAHITEGDMMVGMVTAEGDKYADSSVIADKTVDGTIDRVLVFAGDEGLRRAKIRMRKVRQPMLGDKVASRHSQKGVIGMLVPPQDMPFTKDGLVPDMILNPHAFPSRMCVAHLLEALVSKACAVKGEIADGTVFDPVDIASYSRALAEAGMHSQGNEVMYDGRTGVQMQADIFFTPCYYFRLKHMVADKVNWRRHGPVSTTTRQPVRGRSAGGGLKIGDQEKETLLTNGLASFLGECYSTKCDGKLMTLDEDGQVAPAGRRVVQIPFTIKLLAQELASVGINTSILTGPRESGVSEFDFEETNEETRE
jgi:DNA-directed RNA polymerase II subunit RPB2